MIIAQGNGKKVLFWLFEPPLAIIPSLYLIDKAFNFLSKLSYIALRIFLRIIIGKEKREKLQFCKRTKKSFYINFSFYLFMYVYTIIRLLRIGNPSLIKIYVPKYNYKILCPSNIEDYFNLTFKETDIIELFCPKQNDIVLDVGAHLGRYTIISSNLVGAKGHVLAVEASPLVFENLKRNVNLNKLNNITCINNVVYSKKTKIKLFFPNEGFKNSVYNSVMLTRAQNSGKYLNVDADTLDNIVNSIGILEEKVNWIKIDVEGAELEVLKGAHNILSKSKDIALLIEVHNLENDKNLYNEIINLLNNYNFKIEFEKVYDGGERHVILRKQKTTI
jgi:FkbM family methyltransferase